MRGALSSFTRNTTNLAGFVLLALTTRCALHLGRGKKLAGRRKTNNSKTAAFLGLVASAKTLAFVNFLGRSLFKNDPDRIRTIGSEVHCAADLSIPFWGISHGLMFTAVTECTPSPYCVIDHATKVILRTRPRLPFSDSSQTNS